MYKIIFFICLWYTMSAFAADSFTLTTNSFTNQETIADAYTCDGKDISPQLAWSGIPENTNSLALIVSDIDATGGIFYHWVLYNIPSSVTTLPEDLQQLPEGTLVGKNSWGYQGYKGPCPPKGETHRYLFTLYALDKKLNLRARADAEKIIRAMKDHILDQAELTTSYKH